MPGIILGAKVGAEKKTEKVIAFMLLCTQIHSNRHKAIKYIMCQWVLNAIKKKQSEEIEDVASLIS